MISGQLSQVPPLLTSSSQYQNLSHLMLKITLFPDHHIQPGSMMYEIFIDVLCILISSIVGFTSAEEFDYLIDTAGKVSHGLRRSESVLGRSFGSRASSIPSFLLSEDGGV